MKKHIISGVVVASFISIAPAAWAQSVNGQVTKVDEAQSKITVKHGPIKKLDMDGMTMVFRAADPAMLKQVKPGDRIKFEADRVNGQLTIIKMNKVR